MKLESPSDSLRIGAEIRSLLDEGRPREAVALADATEGDPSLVQQIRAFAWAEAGRPLNDPEMLSCAIAVWDAVGLDHPGVAYSVANCEQDLWEMAVAEDGYAGALEGSRARLHRARALFSQVGDDEASAAELRVQALTNLGNSYDHMGRDVDALDAYDRAIEIDPAFGMALGNKGVALLGIAQHMHGHEHAAYAPAAAAVDAALADEARVLDIGGPSSLEHFRSERGRLTGGLPARHTRTPQPPSWDDPYLEWCFDAGLFLHASQACISPELARLDPLFFSGVFAAVSEEGERRAKYLVEAFNSIKQEYLTARYMTWTAIGDLSPVRDHADQAAERAVFLDTLDYSRWGIRTGMALQAFSAAVNVLDKVAGLTHLYLGTDRVRDVHFRFLWHPRSRGHKPDRMDAEFTAHLHRDEHFNRGLLALCDLSCDVDQDTPLNRFVERRHTATHRFLVAHENLLGELPQSDDWVEHVTWGEVVEGTRELLRIGRAALLYLARTIDIVERTAEQRRAEDGDATVSMPMLPAVPELGL